MTCAIVSACLLVDGSDDTHLGCDGAAILSGVAPSAALGLASSSSDDGKLVIAWAHLSDACRCDMSCLVAPYALLSDSSEGVVVSKELATHSDFAVGVSYYLRAIPDYYVPMAQSVLLEMVPVERSARLGATLDVALSSVLRSHLLAHRVALRTGRYFEWTSPLGIRLRLRAWVQLGATSVAHVAAEPDRSWGDCEWRSWLHTAGIGLFVDSTSFELVPSCEPLHGAGTHGIEELRGLMPQQERIPVPRLAEVLRRVLKPCGGGDADATTYSVALVAGPNDDVALSLLRELCPVDVHMAVLSAASLSEAVGHNRSEASAMAARRWILSRVEVGVPAVVVLVSPARWFGEGPSRYGAAGFEHVLRLLLDRCSWRAAAAGGQLPCMMFVSIFNAPVPKRWSQDKLFDEIMSLGHLPYAAKARGLSSPWRDAQHCGFALEELRGMDEAKDWLARVTQVMDPKIPEGPREGGERPMPHCVAICGPSGSGKTTLLMALAGCSFSVLPLLVPVIINSGVGDTQAAVREHFSSAELLKPACVTLDDADELFANIGQSHTIRDLLGELVRMLDEHCSAQLLFVASCTCPARLPEALACRLHCVTIGG